MNPVAKALWYIEAHYGQRVTLDDLAGVAGVSRFHLSRTFCYATGVPVNRYLRDRRLSQAALALADGNDDILDLALSLGYGSHEAFSRAFKERFGQTPQSVRSQGHTGNLRLSEAMRMSSNSAIKLNEPRIEKRGALLLAGLSRRYTMGTNAAIPSQWQAFAPRIGHVPDQCLPTGYGVVYNIDDEENHEYLCAVEVSSFDRIPDDLSRLRLPEQRYAVFQHDGHVSGIRQTCIAIWNDWLPDSKHEPADAPFFEHYRESFDPRSGIGGIEVWLPIR